MPTVNYTPLLGLALPTQGDLSGSWGNEVNNFITTYIDSAVAGTNTISLTANTALTRTINGGTLSGSSSQYAILNVTPSASGFTLSVPQLSKIYIINNLSSSHTFTFKALGQTGITIAVSEKCVVAYNGSDFVRIGASGGAASFSSITNTGLTSGRVVYSGAGGLEVDSDNLKFDGTTLTAVGLKAISAATQDAVVVQGRAGGTGSYAATITPTTLTGSRTVTLPDANINFVNGLGVAQGGTGQTTYIDGELLIGNSTGNTLTKARLTQGSGVTITNTGGGITIAATGSGGTVTGVTATSPVASSGGAAPVISLSDGYGDTKNPYASKTQKFFLAAPNAADGVPTFRAVVASDIPTLNQDTTGTAAGLSATLAANKGGTGVANDVANTITFTGAYSLGLTLSANTALTLPTSGTLVTLAGTETLTNKTLTSPTLTAPVLGTPASGDLASCTFPQLNQNTTGSAGSVANTLTISSPLSGISFNGSAATTIALAANYGDTQNPYDSKTQNFVLAAPNGSNGVPTFRAIVAADIPTLNQNTTGSSGSCTGNAATATTAAGLSATLVTGSGGTGLTSFTANGILYASSSSALTTGSALSWDGTNFYARGTGASVIATGGTGNQGSASNIGTFNVQRPNISGVPTTWFQIRAFAGAASTGSETSIAYFSTINNGTLTDRMVLNASGNLALSTSNQSWGSNYRALDLSNVGSVAVIGTSTPITSINNNCYNNNTNWVYISTQAALKYTQNTTSITFYHSWEYAASGTAGNNITFSEGMRLDASGNLLIGTTTTSKRLTVYDTNESIAAFQRGTSSIGNKTLVDFVANNTSASPVVYAQIGANLNAVLSGSVNGSFVINTSNTSVVAEKVRVDFQGNVQVQLGAVMPYAPAPASITTTATLTSANIQAQMINASGTSYTITMPNTTTLDSFVPWVANDTAYDFIIINTASGTITLAGTTGVTTVGTMTVLTGISARFRIRRTAASTYIVYRAS